MDLTGLFIAAFLAATVLPGGSEVILLALDHNTEYADWLLVLVATVGNTLGSMSSWCIGSVTPQHAGLRAKHSRAFGWLRAHGALALVWCWVPIVGDPLALIAGWLRLPFWPSLCWIALGKTARYAVLVLFV